MSKLSAGREEERGIALFMVAFLAVTSVALVGAFLSASLAKSRHVDLQAAQADAFEAAETGLRAIATRIWSIYGSRATADRVAAIDGLDGKYDEEQRLRLPAARLGSSFFEASVIQVLANGFDSADVRITAVGHNRSSTRTLNAVLRFENIPSEVFDHAYFINNYGWLWGTGITVNGSVRSNGNMSLQDPVLNGDVIASECKDLGAVGSITGSATTQSIPTYTTKAPSTARPTNPSAPSEDANGNGSLDAGEDKNSNGVLDTYPFEDGFDGRSDRYPNQRMVEMPYLGDFSFYRSLARDKGGKLSIAGRVIVSGVYGDDPGEGTSLVLVGTPANPIVIQGPVVIEGDVALKGTIRGQGTIYAGRNVHLLGNLVYSNPASWPKPMTDAATVIAANQNKDLVGLVARGSIVAGDYTQSSWTSSTTPYMKPPFTSPYVVDEADSSIGYVTKYDPSGRPLFSGDYTSHDGGKKATASPIPITGLGDASAWYQPSDGTASRRYYESSFRDAFVNSVCGGASVSRIDAIMYTNHVLCGRIGVSVFNGTLVARDEALIYTTSVTMNYDLRIRHSGYQSIDIHLPRTPAHRFLCWSEAR